MKHSAQIKTEVEVTLTMTHEEFKDLKSAVVEASYFQMSMGKGRHYEDLDRSLRRIEDDLRRQALDTFVPLTHQRPGR